MVMRLARLGSFHPTRLSFMRALLRELKQDNWRFARGDWKLNARGAGLATYEAYGPARRYTLVCFAHALPDELRSDRVIAERWDATFALYDGVPDPTEIARLRRNVPKQEAGRYRQTELVLARANRSGRLFEYTVAELARGRQPAADRLAESGYLMRTTAVYGNGKFGLSDYAALADRPEFSAPFRAELLTVWLIRWFTVDLIEHLARAVNPQGAARLAPARARRLGVGNATGLGMAPFLGRHPALLHCWIQARETALARVRAIANTTPTVADEFRHLLARAGVGLNQWRTADRGYEVRIRRLQTDLGKIRRRATAARLAEPQPWRDLFHWSQTELSIEGQELLISLLLEPHGQLVDELGAAMGCDETRYLRLRGDQSVAELRRDIARDYAWAMAIDYRSRAARARFWYVSEEKLEPRLGLRFDEPGADKELPLAFARDIKMLQQDLHTAAAGQTMAEFLRARPRHRQAARRAQLAAQLPYCEIRDNLISADLLPVDLLRCKLSFFGANKFDPKSDRWVRITMYQHAPLPYELAARPADDWHYPSQAAPAR